MLEQELKEIWKTASQVERIKFDLSRLMIDLNKKMRSIERAIRRRDRREIVAAVLMIPIYGYLAYEIPFMMSKIGSIVILIWCVYVIFKLRNVQKTKRKTDLSLSFSEQLESQKTHMTQQVKLLDTVLYWYILPPYIGNIIFIFGLSDPSEYEWSNIVLDVYLPLSMPYKIAYLVSGAIVSGVILWLNKSIVKKTLKPLIDETEEVQLQLNSGQ
jgi:hypothetical protein